MQPMFKAVTLTDFNGKMNRCQMNFKWDEHKEKIISDCYNAFGQSNICTGY